VSGGVDAQRREAAKVQLLRITWVWLQDNLYVQVRGQSQMRDWLI
jgi:hypothetical protein